MQQNRSISRRGAVAALAATASALTATPVLAQMGMRVPVDGDDAIAILEHDHRRIKMMLDRIAASTDAEANRATFGALVALLTVHNATEENLVYPAIAKIADRPTDAATLYHQQDTAKEVVWSLDQIDDKGSPHFVNGIVRLRTAVLAHVAMEEGTDFPALRRAAGPKLAAITTKVRAFRARFS